MTKSTNANNTPSKTFKVMKKINIVTKKEQCKSIPKSFHAQSPTYNKLLELNLLWQNETGDNMSDEVFDALVKHGFGHLEANRHLFLEEAKDTPSSKTVIKKREFKIVADVKKTKAELKQRKFIQKCLYRSELEMEGYIYGNLPEECFPVYDKLLELKLLWQGEEGFHVSDEVYDAYVKYGLENLEANRDLFPEEAYPDA